jgi:5-bromo-4-chloroindolyl phosphate hydrolysis protein
VKWILDLFIRVLITLPSMIFIWVLVYFLFHHQFLVSSAVSIFAGFVVYQCLKWMMTRKFLKQQGLSRKEYRFIRKNLKDAKVKIKRLQKAFLSVRRIDTFRLFYDMYKLVRKIYGLIKKEPKRFYQAESFFYVHLDSMVELAEKYALLNTQPVQNKEMIQSVQETKRTLQELHHEVEKDLYQLLSNDMDELHFELEYAKRSLKHKQPLSRVERRNSIND